MTGVSVASAAVLSSLLSWATMMVTFLAGGLIVEGAYGHLRADNWSEYALMAPVVMALPFAFAVVAIYLPTALVAIGLERSRWLSARRVALWCVAAAPIAGLLLLIISHELSPNHGPLMRDLARLRTSASIHLLAPFAALSAGALVFGLNLASQLRRSTS